MNQSSGLKFFLLGLVAAMAVLSVVEAGTIIAVPYTKFRTYGGDHYGTFTLCDSVAFMGGNRPGDTVRNTVLRVAVSESNVGVWNINILPRSRYVNGTVALAIGQVVFAMPVADGIASSNIIPAFNSTNCYPNMLPKDAQWTSYQTYNATGLFPADAIDFVGAVVNKRYAVFGSGQHMDGSSVLNELLVIDSTTNGLSALTLSSARTGVAAVTSTDGTAWFAGGSNGDETVYDTIDIVRSDLKVNSTLRSLSQARGFLAGASTHSLIMLGGGVSGYVTENDTITTQFSDVIDVFNTATGEQSTHRLSVARGMLTATATDDFIVFAGGITSSVKNATSGEVISETYARRVDIYHVPTNTWTVAELSEGRAYPTAAGTSHAVVVTTGLVFNVTSQTQTHTNFFDAYYLLVASPASSLRPFSVFTFLASLFA